MQIASTPSIPVATPGPAKEIPAGTPPPVDQAPDTKEAVKRVGLQFDKQQQVAIQREWDKPVTQNERVGGIPQDYYEHAFAPPMPGYGYWPTREYSQSANGGSTDMGPVGVNREVPVYEADGKPKMEHVSQTLTEKTHNQKTTTLVGGGVGAVLGAGLAVGVLAAMGGLGGAAGVVGGLMGGVAGAAAGAAAGYKAVAGDKIEEVWMKEQILHPHMTGYTERITPDVWHEQRPVHGGPGRHFGPGGPGGPGHRPGPGGPGGPGHHPGPGGPGGGVRLPSATKPGRTCAATSTTSTPTSATPRRASSPTRPCSTPPTSVPWAPGSSPPAWAPELAWPRPWP